MRYGVYINNYCSTVKARIFVEQRGVSKIQMFEHVNALVTINSFNFVFGFRAKIFVYICSSFECNALLSTILVNLINK